MPFDQALKVVDEVLHHGIQGIAEIITQPGLINVDFADVKAIMSQAGSALMAIGRGTGENRAVDAAQAAISSPLLEASIQGARGVLFNVTGGNDLTLHEVTEAAGIISQAADPEANIIFGAVIDPRLEGEIKITAIATGFDAHNRAQPRVFPGLASANNNPGAPRFPAAPPPREPAPNGEDADLPSFMQRRSGPAASPGPGPGPSSAPRPPAGRSGETPLPEFLRSLRDH
jgi:cell division protein FtsZ